MIKEHEAFVQFIEISYNLSMERRFLIWFGGNIVVFCRYKNALDILLRADYCVSITRAFYLAENIHLPHGC